MQSQRLRNVFTNESQRLQLTRSCAFSTERLHQMLLNVFMFAKLRPRLHSASTSERQSQKLHSVCM